MSEAHAQGVSLRAKLFALLCAAAFVIYGPGLVGAFVWDDHGLIVSNAYLHDLSRLPALLRADFWRISATNETGGHLTQMYWRPVVTLAYVLEYQLFGAEPLGYHLVNFALHVACSLLAWGFVRRRIEGSDAHRDLAAAMGALVFVAHPSRPESVTWISGSTDLWMTLWVLLAARVLDGRGARRGALAGALLAAALLSKESAVVAPVLLVTDAWLIESLKPRRRESLVAAAITACALVMRLAMRPPRALMSDGATAVAETVQRALSSLGLYVASALWPWSPSAQLGYREWRADGSSAFSTWSVALGAVAVGVFVALAARAWRSSAWRPVLADALWFLAPLTLVLNVVDLRLNVLAAQRFLYLPMLGLAALAARGAARLLARERRGVAMALGGAAVTAMAVVSIGHVGHFITDEDLWAYETAHNPRNAYAWQELARTRLEQGHVEEAVTLYGRAVVAAGQIHNRGVETELVLRLATTVMLATPDDDQATLVRVRDFFDAVERGDAGPIALEARRVRVALRWSPEERDGRRTLYQYRVARAIVHARTMSLAEAERQLLEVLRATPEAWLAWQNLALVYVTTDRWDAAVRSLDEGIRRDPANAQARALRDTIARERSRVTALREGSYERELAACESLLGLHLFEAARRRLDALIVRDPGRPEARELRRRVPG